MSINLLPDNLRNREKSELKKAQKAQKNNIQMHDPTASVNFSKKDEKKKQKKIAKQKGSSFFSFFSKKDNKNIEDKKEAFLKKTTNQELKKSKSDKKQDIQNFIEKIQTNNIVKKNLQSFQDYKKSKIEKQKEENNNKQKKYQKEKLENSSKPIKKKRFKSSDSEVNFISGDLMGSIKIKIREKFFIMFFSLGLSVIILFSLYVLTSWYQSFTINKINEIKNKIKETHNRIDVYEKRKDEIIEFQTKLNAIDYLIQNHIYNTNLLENLEKYTLTNVYYNNLNADVQGNVSISAVTDSFASVAKQLIVFQQAKDFVEFVEINSATFGDLSDKNVLPVSFDINLKVNNNVFFK